VGRPFHNESVLGAVKWDPYFHFCEKENSAEIQLSVPKLAHLIVHNLHRKLISTQDIRNVGRPFHNESVLGAVKWDPYFHFCEKKKIRLRFS
jgi:hypothetical protein